MFILAGLPGVIATAILMIPVLFLLGFMIETVFILFNSAKAPDEVKKQLNFVLTLSERQGINLKVQPRIRIFNKYYSGMFLGKAFIFYNIILIRKDAPLSVYAHELGHVVDSRRGRQHPIPESLRKQGSEHFADSFAEFIMGEPYRV